MENELIPIINENGKRAVDARMLHDFLGSKREFATWIKDRIDKCDLVEKQDFISFDKIVKRENGATTRKEYVLSLDAAKEISMIEGNEKGKKARRYFIEVEKEYKKNLLALPNFNNPAEAARAWADQYEKTKQQEQRAIEAEQVIKEQQPKVLFADSILASKTSCLIGELAKILTQNGRKIGQNKLFKWLRGNGYLCTRGEQYNLPQQKYVDCGFFEIKKSTHSENEVLITTSTTKVTPKGQQYFINKFLNS